MPIEVDEGKAPADGRPVDVVESALAAALNRLSVENRSNTPDFVLARLLRTVLEGFEVATSEREAWYGVALAPGRTGGAPVTAERAAELVFVALGAVSMCWEHPEQAGEFLSRRASAVGTALMNQLGFEVPRSYVRRPIEPIEVTL